jgi:predicted Zn-dependent protease
MKFRPLGVELLVRTDMSKLIFVFRNFQNAPKNREDLHHKQVYFSQVMYAQISYPIVTV